MANEVTDDDLLSFLYDEAFVNDDAEGDNVDHDEEGVTAPPLENCEIIKSGLDECEKGKINVRDRICDSSSASKRKKMKLARDVRETYGDRIFKAFNEHDFPPLLALFNSICLSSTCLYFNKKVKQPQKEIVAQSTCVKGPLNIAQFYYGIVTMEPDGYLTLKKSKFYPESPSGLIVLNLEYRATKMYNVESTYKSFAATVERGPTDPNDDQGVAKWVAEINEVRDQLPVRKTCIKIFAKGFIRAYTNQDKKLTQIVSTLNFVESELPASS